MKKYLIATGVAFFAVVLFAHAQSYSFSNDLYTGSSGPDVISLQTWLISNGYNIPAISSGLTAKGYFGIQTQAALIAYQRAIGLPAFGFFGPLTRGRLNGGGTNYGGGGTTNPQAPFITILNAPASLAVGQTGTWNIQATDPQNGTLSYSVNWGDNYPVPVPNYGANNAMQSVQSTSFTHAYSAAGTYTITFTVSDTRGLTTTKTTIVNIGGLSSSLITVLSPNGGESWQIGTTHQITWNAAPNISTTNYSQGSSVDISLVPYQQPCTNQICPMIAQLIRAPYTVATNVPINQNSYNWDVGVTGSCFNGGSASCATMPVIPSGQYTIQICQSGTSNCDSSNAPFTIYSGTQTGQPPVITGVDAPTALTVNQVDTWTIHATDPQNGTLSYSVNWGDTACPSGYACASPAAANIPFVQSTTFTHSYANPGTYTVTFTVYDSAGLSAQTSSTVNVTGSTTAGPLRVTSPNGGEIWTLGTTQNIAWTSPYYLVATNVDITVLSARPACPAGMACTWDPVLYTIATNIPINQNSYAWNVGRGQLNPSTGSIQTMSPGQYIMQVCQSGTSTCDTSDAPFTITVPYYPAVNCPVGYACYPNTQ